MRRILVFAVAAAMTAGVASCGGGGEPETPGERITDPARVPSAEAMQNPTLFRIVGNEVIISGGQSGEITPVAANTPAASADYEVVSGDLCSTIAADHGITLDALLAANRTVDCDNLRIGDRLKIPSAEAPTPTRGPGAVATPRPGTTSGGQSYTVQAGDLCSTIAADHGVSVDAFLAANPEINADCTNLREGQTVSIP